MSQQAYTYPVETENAGRLDKFLCSKLPEHSRSRLQGLISDGFVRVNEQVVTKSGTPVEAGDQVEILIPPAVPVNLEPEDIPLDILFENKDVLIVNKPAGMVVHPAAGHYTGTLVQAAMAHIPDLEGIGGELRPGVVHRLDKDTSGLILMAKNEQAHNWLQDQFRLRKVRKTYLALVDGKPPTPTGRVEASIARDPAHRKQMAIVPDGKGRSAVTEYRVVEQFRGFTLVEAHPLTGRTHQIRLHMAFLGCPIVGDTLYGHHRKSLEIDRHFLHAARITLLLPGEQQEQTFEAPLPSDLLTILEKLRQQ